jgi:hypothetical protein
VVVGEGGTSRLSYRDLDEEVDYESDKSCQCSMAKVSISEKLRGLKSSDGCSMTAQLLLPCRSPRLMNNSTHYQRL